MPFRTRLTRLRMTNKSIVGFGSDPDTLSYVESGSDAVRNNSVTLDYPSWDYKYKIRHGQCATTVMNGVRYGFCKVSDLGPCFDDRNSYRLPLTEFVNLEAYGLARYRYKNTNIYDYREFKGAVGGLLDLPPGYTDSLIKAEQQAKLRFNNKILKAQRDLQGYVFAGELRDTLKLIRNPARAFRKGLDDYLRDLKKGLHRTKRYNRSEGQRIVADTWLEYSFGWKPLVNDVDEGIQSLCRYLYKRLPQIFISAGATDTCTFTYSIPNASLANVSFINGRAVAVGISQHRLYGIVRVDDTTGNIRSFGTSFLDVVPAVWELIPYSFLVDYFTNIGDIINAFSINRANIRWVSYGTRRILCTYLLNPYIEFKTPMPSAPDYKRVSGDSVVMPADIPVYCEESVSRGTYSVYNPFLDLQFEIPGFSTKWINMSALLFARNQILRR
jgi:hypothetical protein